MSRVNGNFIVPSSSSSGSSLHIPSHVYFFMVNITCMREEADTSSPFIWQAVICVIQPIRALHDMTSYNTLPSSHRGRKNGKSIYSPIHAFPSAIPIVRSPSDWNIPSYNHDCTTGMNERNQLFLTFPKKKNSAWTMLRWKASSVEWTPEWSFLKWNK